MPPGYTAKCCSVSSWPSFYIFKKRSEPVNGGQNSTCNSYYLLHYIRSLRNLCGGRAATDSHGLRTCTFFISTITLIKISKRQKTRNTNGQVISKMALLVCHGEIGTNKMYFSHTGHRLMFFISTAHPLKYCFPATAPIWIRWSHMHWI